MHPRNGILQPVSPPPVRVSLYRLAFVGASIEDAARYGVIVEDSGFHPSRMDGDALFETLLRLALDDERQAAA